MANGYQSVSIKEGNAPFLMAKVTDKAGTIVVKADISTITISIKNITAGTTVLASTTALSKTDVWFDTYQTLVDADGDTVTYNFGYQTLASYFATTSFPESSQFKVEVLVTPVSGQPFDAGWWFITAQSSIAPLT